MKIDQSISDAIKESAVKVGSIAELARISDIAEPNIHRFLKGRVESISSELYERLYPHIQPYLNRHPRYWPRSKLIMFACKFSDNDLIKFRHEPSTAKLNINDEDEKILLLYRVCDGPRKEQAIKYVSGLAMKTLQDLRDSLIIGNGTNKTGKGIGDGNHTSGQSGGKRIT